MAGITVFTNINGHTDSVNYPSATRAEFNPGVSDVLSIIENAKDDKDGKEIIAAQHLAGHVTHWTRAQS